MGLVNGMQTTWVAYSLGRKTTRQGTGSHQGPVKKMDEEQEIAEMKKVVTIFKLTAAFYLIFVILCWLSTIIPMPDNVFGFYIGNDNTSYYQSTNTPPDGGPNSYK